MKFVHLEDAKNEDDCTNMSCRFHLATKIPLTVNRGEALIQFEEESGIWSAYSNDTFPPFLNKGGCVK